MLLCHSYKIFGGQMFNSCIEYNMFYGLTSASVTKLVSLYKQIPIVPLLPWHVLRHFS